MMRTGVKRRKVDMYVSWPRLGRREEEERTSPSAVHADFFSEKLGYGGKQKIVETLLMEARSPIAY